MNSEDMKDEELLKVCEEALTGGHDETYEYWRFTARYLARALKSRLRPGYVLVPVEPTDAMLAAGDEAGDFHILCYDGIDKPGTPRYSLRESYIAMLKVAKEPQ